MLQRFKANKIKFSQLCRCLIYVAANEMHKTNNRKPKQKFSSGNPFRTEEEPCLGAANDILHLAILQILHNLQPVLQSKTMKKIN